MPPFSGKAPTGASQITTTFWNAYLKGKSNARLWLAKGGLAKWIAKKGAAEIKWRLTPA